MIEQSRRQWNARREGEAAGQQDIEWVNLEMDKVKDKMKKEEDFLIGEMILAI